MLSSKAGNKQPLYFLKKRETLACGSTSRTVEKMEIDENIGAKWVEVLILHIHFNVMKSFRFVLILIIHSLIIL